MERLLADEGIREQLRAKGLERARLFTWEKTARETLKIYEEVYNGKWGNEGAFYSRVVS